MGRGRAPCCEKVGLNKGSWTPAEDMRLVAYIQKFGHGNWRALPKHAGLLRCGKSCRLRWINYLRPDIKRGNFTKEEEDTIINLHALLGNKWSKIASYLPGRTDNEIKNVWNTHLKKRLITSNELETPSPSSSASIPCSSSDQSEAKSTSCDGETETETDDYNRTLAEFESLTGAHDDQEVHQEEKIEIPDYDFDIGELVIFDELMLDIPVENNSSCNNSLNFEEKQENENGNESKKWLAYLEKELDLWGGGEDKQEHENEDIVDMESDPVLSYFQRGPSTPPSPLDSFMTSNLLTQ
ncbi:hypothetical protein J5N97_008284 [Dioscorea zingiberensis]|uniref:Uncharacterized protein n=1 Tax=Dioscorea zingiberensis TaxID=325984 RepID=A0A9D5HVM0_9LILI|nr:hypothetical protein J5N97_008284 [Dioscorea zingiberensis]